MANSVTPKRAQAFKQLVESSTKKVRALNNILDQEKLALEKREHDAIVQLADSKQSILDQLGRAERELQGALAIMGFTMKTEDIEALLQKIPGSWQRMLRDQWNTLQNALRESKDKNEVNSRIVHHNKHALDKMIGLLRGQTQSNVYSAKGRTRTISDTRLLANA